MARSRMVNRSIFVEDEPTLKESPMFTADEVEIKVNSVLYRTHWTSGYRFKSEGKANVEALRVFHVNNTARMFRVRCIKGCEEVFKIANGCGTVPLYGKFNSAVASLNESIEADLKSCTEKNQAVVKTLVAIKEERLRLRGLGPNDIKMPRAVK